MRLLKLLDDKLEAVLCIILLSVMTVVVFIQVIMRYVVQDALAWSEELSRYLFVWLIYLGIPLGAKHMKHIKIEAPLSLFPRKARKYVVILGDIIFLAFCVIIAVTTYTLVLKQSASGQTSPAMGIPMWIVYLAPCVGFALTSIRQIQVLVYRIRNNEEH